MIRQATKYDIPVLVEMMKKYAAQAPVPVLREIESHNSTHVEMLLKQILVGRGFILIDDQNRGFIAALIVPNVWCPKVYELRELAWWVEPEYRNSTIGGRLWHKFDSESQMLLDSGRVSFVCTSIMANSPFIDYTKRGYKPMEATFFKD